jgi:succinate dehydrogenase / fumarate reductase, membrane anchor subunit
MRQSIRTPLGKVRGLGSAKEGSGHFIGQRVSAIALIVLVPLFLVSLLSATAAGFDGARAWIAQPLNAILTLLATGAALYHMRLGLQTVIEDYIGKTAARIALLIANTFVALGLFVACAYSVFTLAA